ncbi:hypothetical protein B0F90DRAFT_1401922 [Multifurca ochricompacta]|uniref:Uncharacterized protein n=1 Tax=Multifurca ochricompacta TaxID=376703 RepID=A0AAD4QK18_9AGAM|nr:hypothetical protein B0F90DRAFT_1401922 [Multifurca ochricompacta]
MYFYLNIMLPPQPPPVDTIAGSGSIQSHLSALNSHPRHRDHAAALARSVSREPTAKVPPVLISNLEKTRHFSHCLISLIRDPTNDLILPGPDSTSPRPRIWPNSFRWLLSVYIIVSVIFFSASLYHGFYASKLDNRASPASSQTPSPVLSGLNALSSTARLAKLFALHPPPAHFSPFTYRSAVDPYSHEITACLWAPESNLDWVPAWTTDWQGNCPLCLEPAHLLTFVFF